MQTTRFFNDLFEKTFRKGRVEVVVVRCYMNSFFQHILIPFRLMNWLFHLLLQSGNFLANLKSIFYEFDDLFINFVYLSSVYFRFFFKFTQAHFKASQFYLFTVEILAGYSDSFDR